MKNMQIPRGSLPLMFALGLVWPLSAEETPQQGLFKLDSVKSQIVWTVSQVAEITECDGLTREEKVAALAMLDAAERLAAYEFEQAGPLRARLAAIGEVPAAPAPVVQRTNGNVGCLCCHW